MTLPTVQSDFSGDQQHLQALAQCLGDAAAWSQWRSAQLDAHAAVRLRGANLSGCNLAGFDLSAADLQACNLQASDLRGADLRSANLLMADCAETDFREACLDDAQATGAYFAKADLRGASLKRVDVGEGHMKKAKLDGAQLHGAQLQWTRAVSASMLASANGDAATSIPEATTRPAHWESA